MDIIKGKHLGPLGLLPAKEGTCSQCAVKHEPEQPHNRDSMFYQYRFYNEFGRWPTWVDAMEHCSFEVKDHWIRSLKELGVKI